MNECTAHERSLPRREGFAPHFPLCAITVNPHRGSIALFGKIFCLDHAMIISREEYQKKLNLLRRIINAFMCLILMLPLVGIVALISGVVQPGDGKGSMTIMEVSLVLAASSLFVIVLWKLFSMALNWIARRQIAILFPGD